MTLTQEDVDELRGRNDRIDLDEVVAIYLPLSRLLNLYVAATQKLFRATTSSCISTSARCPMSSAWRGASRPARAPRRVSCSGFSRAGRTIPRSTLVTTDGFLLPNAILEREGLMNRKGFPESYDLPAMLRFLSDIKAGQRERRCARLFASHL